MALVVLPKQLVVDGSGNPRSGAKAYFYQSGTATPITVYTTSDYSVAHSNPVIANASGLFPAVYINPAVHPTYKLVVKDSSGVEIYSEDKIPALGFTQSDVGATLYPRTAAEIAAGVTPVNYAYPPGDARRYGAVGDGVADDTAALQDWLSVGGRLTARGTFRVTGSLKVTQDHTHINAPGMKIVHDSSVSEIVLEISGRTDVTVRGIEIDGRKDLKSSAGGHYGIGVIGGGETIRIEHNYVHDCGEHGIRAGTTNVNSPTPKLIIANNVIENCGSSDADGAGIWLFGLIQRAVVTGNLVVDCFIGIQVDDTSTGVGAPPGFDCLDVVIADNVVYESTPVPYVGSLTAVGIALEGTRRFTVTGNVVTGYMAGCRVRAIQGMNTATGRGIIANNYFDTTVFGLTALSITNTIIANNLIVMETTDTDRPRGGIELASNDFGDGTDVLDNVHILGNHIITAQFGIRHGLAAAPDPAHADDSGTLTIKGNHIQYVGASPVPAQTYRAVHIQGLRRLIAEGNTIDGGFYDGLFTESLPTPSEIVYIGNTVLNCERYGIRLSGATGTEFVVHGNFTVGNGSGGLRLEGSARKPSVSIAGNTFMDGVEATGISGLPSWAMNYDGPSTPYVTAANLADIAHSINTSAKWEGKLVWDTTNNRMLRASGPDADDPWVVVDGSATVVPSS